MLFREVALFSVDYILTLFKLKIFVVPSRVILFGEKLKK
jgi:hypothetical protein